jgi:hypothetical protein
MTLAALPQRPTSADVDDTSRPDRPRRRACSSPAFRQAWVPEAIGAVRADRVRLRTLQARGDRRPLPPAEADELHEGIEEMLCSAENAALGVEPRHRRFTSWWQGDCVEAAFHNLHRAEAEMVRLYSDDEVDAEIAEAIARTDIGLHRNDARRCAAHKLVSMKDADAKRILLSKVVQIGHEAADRQHSRVRVFRNIVLVTAMLLAVFVSFFVFCVYQHPSAVPLCFTNPGPSIQHCPTGGGAPSAGDVGVVALLGLLGGALAAAVSIRNVRGTSAPYNVGVALALLKFPAGAFTALAALIAIGGELVPGLTALDTQPQILAYALLFGYAQQLLTGLIDKRALSLLSTVPGKDPTQDRQSSYSWPSS